MATNSKVFVSPGVYTSEVDLSFVAQSVGVTTLGVVGETLKGPAFEPIFIRNFDEFSTFFGGTSPEKFVNTQIPKYEAAYIAKSYLQQSNQLFVTRILGLSGYDAGPSWSIKTVANVDPTTIVPMCEPGALQTINCELVCTNYLNSAFTMTFTGCTNGTSSISITNVSPFPPELNAKLNLPFEQFNGDVSTLMSQIKTQVFNTMVTPSTSGSSIYYFGAVPNEYYTGNTSNGYSARTDVFEVTNLISEEIDYTDRLNDAWYYAMFDNIGGGQYTGSSFYTYVTGLTQTSSASNCASFYNYSVNGHVTTLEINNGGSTYSNATNVATTTTGNGVGLTVNIGVDSGVITGATVYSAGTGYQVGDTVTVAGGDGTAILDIVAISSTVGNINYNTKEIFVYLPDNLLISPTQIVSSFSACTSNVKIGAVAQVSGDTSNDFTTCLTYTLTSEDNTVTNNWLVCVTNDDPCNPASTGTIGSINTGTITNCFTGTVVGNLVYYDGESYKDYDDLVVTTLRSRGLANYSDDDGAVYEVSGLTQVSLDMSGVYSGVTKNPYLTFLVNATGRTGTQYSFETSLSNSDAKYVTKLFGMSNFSKDRTSVPLFVEERYQALLNYGWRKGFIRVVTHHQ
jgi:hypothetical protein